MVEVLGNILKINSIDVFPQSKDKPNSFLRVKNDESGYELIDNEGFLEDLNISSKDAGCINSQAQNHFCLINNETLITNPYTILASDNTLPNNNINDITTTTISFNEAQTYPLEVARVAEYTEGYYKFDGYCNADDFVIYITYENGDTQIVPYDKIIEIKKPFTRVTYRINECSRELNFSISITNVNVRLEIILNNLKVTFGDGETKTFNDNYHLYPKPKKHFEKITNNFTEGRYWFKPLEDNAYIKVYNEDDWTQIASKNINNVVDLKSFYSAKDCIVYKEVNGEIKNLDDIILEQSSYIQESQNVFLRKDGSSYFSSGKMFMQSSEPENPSEDDRWFDTKQLPLWCYRFNGETWEECNDVLLGNINFIDGIAINTTECLLNYNGTLFPKNAQLQFKGKGYAYHNLNIDPERFEVTSSNNVPCYLTKNIVGEIPYIPPQESTLIFEMNDLNNYVWNGTLKEGDDVVNNFEETIPEYITTNATFTIKAL